MALINISNPAYIKKVLEGEVLREMRELMSGGELNDEVRMNVNELFQVIDAIEDTRLYGDVDHQREVARHLEDHPYEGGNPFNTEATQEKPVFNYGEDAKDGDKVTVETLTEGAVNSLKGVKFDNELFRKQFLGEWDNDIEKALVANSAATIPLVVRAMRLTKENFDAVADVFEIDREELQKHLVAPSATPPFIVGVGMGVFQVYKVREFQKKFEIKEEQNNGLLFVTKK